MIKILTLFRIVPDYDQVLKEDWKNVNHLNTEFTPKMLDTFDEGALEGALRLKDQLTAAGEEVKCTAIGSGLFKDTLLSSLYAAGYDQVVFYDSGKLREEVFLEKTMSEIKAGEYDVIFTGNESGPFSYRMDGPLVAAQLNCPWFSDVTEAAFNGERLDVTVETDEEYVTYKSGLPCVCSFGNATHPVLRLFSLKARMDAMKKEIPVKKISKFSLIKDDVRLEVRTKEKSCRFIEKDNEDIVQFIKKAAVEGKVE